MLLSAPGEAGSHCRIYVRMTLAFLTTSDAFAFCETTASAAFQSLAKQKEKIDVFENKCDRAKGNSSKV